jgi:peptidoglycan/xylan/chitin deacetylase (PgdA/CDA1 family)
MRRIAAVAALLLASCGTVRGAAPGWEIAFTIDDLPVHAPYPAGMMPLDVNRQMVASLKAAGVPVTGFVNAVNVTDPTTMEALRDWRSAGFVLGNHSWSHQHLSELTIAQFEEELTKDEPILAKLGVGTDWRWFRYPFLDEGKDATQRDAARYVLARHGYRVAAVTMSFSDWAFTPAFARCSEKHDARGLARLEQLYLAAVQQSIRDDRETAHKLYERDIPYVLLMHVSAMSAHMMPRVIRLYRESGFHFVSLGEAEHDPVYAGYTDLRLPAPRSSAEAAKENGVKLPPPPDYSTSLDTICA